MHWKIRKKVEFPFRSMFELYGSVSDFSNPTIYNFFFPIASEKNNSKYHYYLKLILLNCLLYCKLDFVFKIKLKDFFYNYYFINKTILNIHSC
ncbi:hypothetical protein J2S17_001351 [Cytobacillus purgationiresistens]|uniref:Uncharacterized protein n=1 Tax=Cytobacillus purgationiresistens TaxID=863449 RepID=A0ABU0AHF0_9BACI|nr:hypothetical protein [Cytobacillus purgationiresistens]